MVAPLVGLAVGAAARAVAKKVAGSAAKKAVTKKAATKANARALKAAKGPSLAKGAKKTDASSGAYERAIVKMKAQDNMILGSSKKAAFEKASKASDAARVKNIAESKKILARAAAEKKAKTISKNLKNTKPMENVPKGVSARFDATVKRLAAEEAKKKKK